MSASLDPVVAVALRATLALLFFEASLHKLRDFSAFVAALAGYEIVAARAARATARLVVGLELVASVGLALVPGPSAPVLAALLLTGYAGAIALNLRRGRRDIDCGCAGPAGRLSLRPALVVRNLLLAGAALIAALPAAARALTGLDVFAAGAAITAASLLYVAAETALANSGRVGFVRERT